MDRRDESTEKRAQHLQLRLELALWRSARPWVPRGAAYVLLAFRLSSIRIWLDRTGKRIPKTDSTESFLS